MKSFESDIPGLNKGLRKIDFEDPEEGLIECHNLAPGEEGLLIHEQISEYDYTAHHLIISTGVYLTPTLLSGDRIILL